MARFVLLSFDDNAEADRFVEAHKAKNLFLGGLIDSDDGPRSEWRYQNFSGKGEVLGLFQKPTQFCDCREKGTWKKTDGWSQGKKFGLWVHNRCGRVSRVAWEHIEHKLTGFGFNLLLPEGERAPTYARWAPEVRKRP